MRSRPHFNVSGNVDLGVVCTLDRATEASLYVSRYTGISPVTFTLQRNSVSRVGRAGANDIAMRNTEHISRLSA